MGNVTSSIAGKGVGSQKARRLSCAPPSPPKCYPNYVSAFVELLHAEFFQSVCSLLIHHSIFWQGRRKDPPLRFRKPKQLYELIDFSLKQHGTKHKHLIDYIRKIMHYSPPFPHPYYMFQLLSGMDPYGLIGDFLASISPSKMSAYIDAPVYNLMEEEISLMLRQLAGYPEGTGDCIFPPGCTIGNCYGIFLARHSKFPETKKKGILHLPPLAIFISQDAHCSYQRAAIYTGIGLENVILVKTDAKGKMSVPHLVKAIEESQKAGKVPLMVGATSGTNVLGAFDPIEDISKVCKQYGMWLHCDGALGGGLIFSEKQRNYRLQGIHLCDSFCGSFHKIGSATQTMTYLLTPHDTIFTESLCLGRGGEDFSSFMEVDANDDDVFHSERDTYEKYVDNTRRPDIAKLFMMIKGKGLKGMGENVDDAYERSQFLLDELKRRLRANGKFVALMDEYESPVISFYYVPTYLHRMDRTTPEFKDRLNLHTSFLLGELIKNGVMVITAQSLRQSPLFFKISTFDSALSCKDILYLIDQIDNYGSYLRVPFETPLNENALVHEMSTSGVEIIGDRLIHQNDDSKHNAT